MMALTEPAPIRLIPEKNLIALRRDDVIDRERCSHSRRRLCLTHRAQRVRGDEELSCFLPSSIIAALSSTAACRTIERIGVSLMHGASSRAHLDELGATGLSAGMRGAERHRV
jgi:hypothetical protein